MAIALGPTTTSPYLIVDSVHTRTQDTPRNAYARKQVAAYAPCHPALIGQVTCMVSTTSRRNKSPFLVPPLNILSFLIPRARSDLLHARSCFDSYS